MDLEARIAALEAEVTHLKASQGVVTAPFRVQSPEGKTLVEVSVDDDGQPEIRLYHANGFPVIKLLAEEGGSAILFYAEDKSAFVAMRADERGGEIQLFGNNGHSTASLQTPDSGGQLELSNAQGNDGLIFGTQFGRPEPALWIYGRSADPIVYLGPRDDGHGMLRVGDADGWGGKYFPSLLKESTPTE